jgi:hypothetical protein
MTAWESLAAKNTALEPYINVALERAYHYYQRMDRSPAYIIAMSEYIFFVIILSLSRICNY